MEEKVFPVEDEVTRKRITVWERMFLNETNGCVTDAISSLKPYIWKCVGLHKIEWKWSNIKEIKDNRQYFVTVKLY